MTIREAEESDLKGLLELYTHLGDNPVPEINESLVELWHKILSSESQRVIVGLAGGELVSSCVLIVVRNLSHGQRPYAFVENVVTHAAYRNRGCATRVLDYARDAAVREGCYKIMLLTGSKRESTLRFYEKAGYDRSIKTGFIQPL
ncbi:MAG: GNAT family N-acetyltransferase [Defluviitaleaceae bacterium]|nr:GNAT family N-acetyltransferase [Defluviitaleaceae bacterium]